MSNVTDMVYSKSSLEFAAVAKGYCELLEAVNKYGLRELVGILEKLLPLLFYKATILPVFEPLSEVDAPRAVTEEVYEKLYLELLDKFNQHDTFPEVFDKRINETDDPFSASISEYLADIYQDLKNFTVAYQSAQHEAMNDALWECQSNFREFWGIKLTNVLRAIHILNGKPLDLDFIEENDDETAPSDEHHFPEWLQGYFQQNDE